MKPSASFSLYGLPADLTINAYTLSLAGAAASSFSAGAASSVAAGASAAGSSFAPHPTTRDATIATHKSALNNLFFIFVSSLNYLL